MNNWAFAAFTAIGLGIIAAFAVGYLYLRNENHKERAKLDQAIQVFLTYSASGEMDKAYSLLCPELVEVVRNNQASLTRAIEGYDGHRRFRGSLTVPIRGLRTFEYEATTHFSDGTEGWLNGMSEKRDGSWCILGIELSPRDKPVIPVTAPTQSPTEPSTGQHIEFEWVETDGGCNLRKTLSGSASQVEFLAIRFRGTSFGNAEKVLVKLSRNGSSMRSTAPLVVPAGGGVNNLCFYGPVQGQSPGGWPPGLYEVEFRLVGGASVATGNLRID